MPFTLFGFKIGKDDEKKNKKALQQSFTLPLNEDGAIVVDGAGAFGTYFDLEGMAQNENELITRYREMSMQPEVDSAIGEIVNEAIVTEERKAPVSIVLDKLNYTDEFKHQVMAEFDNILNLLDFNNEGQDIFRRWYVDGRLFYHVIIDTKKPQDGIQELREIDPRCIKKVKQIDRELDVNNIEVVGDVQEYYVYSESGINTSGPAGSDVLIAPDSVVFVHSGLRDHRNNMILSYLHKAIKPLNQLRIIEDATVIYRLSRAPERRVFYVDVGNLPRPKAEQYVKDMMNRYRNKMVYDASTGAVRDDKRFMSMMEDYWMPRREGQRSTEITTLPGGCLAMDTKVPLLDGRTLTLSEMATEYQSGKQNWVYSTNPQTGEIVPGIVSWAGVTHERAKVMKLTLDNGQSLVCTPDHKFPILGKGKVRADELTVGESMIALNREHKKRKNKDSDYENVYQNHAKKWQPTHRMVTEFLQDTDQRRSMQFPNMCAGRYINTVHHLDFNRYNNDPSNLIWMEFWQHRKFHRALISENREQILSQLIGNIPEGYVKRCLEAKCCNIGEIFKSLPIERQKLARQKVAVGLRNHFATMTPEQRTVHANHSRAAFQKATKRHCELMENDPVWRIWKERRIADGIAKAQQAPKWEQFRQGNSRRSRSFWQDPEYRTKVASHSAKKLQFPKAAVDLVKSMLHDQAERPVILNAMNTHVSLRTEFSAINNKIRNFKPEDGFVGVHLNRMAVQQGYRSFAEWRNQYGDYGKRPHPLVWTKPMMDRFVTVAKKLCGRCDVYQQLIKDHEFIHIFQNNNPTHRFKRHHVRLLVRYFGYKDVKHACCEVGQYNHRIVKIETLPNEMQVGTLTIDTK